MDRRSFLRVAGGVAGAGLGVLGYGSLVEPRWVDITTRTLPRPRDAASSPSLVQISDLHLEDVGEPHAAIAEAVVRRSPELVLITGDAVDSSRAIPALESFLALLPYGIPKLAVLGNWEHWGRVDRSRLAAAYERANGTLLVNRSVEQETRGGEIRVTGLDDLVGGSPDLTAIPGGRDTSLHLLLAHCPAQRDRLGARAVDVDLILSGHTHGGQIQLFGHAPVVPRGSGRYLEGWYRDGGPPLYVSRGVGTSVVPVRVGARPEITFFE